MNIATGRIGPSAAEMIQDIDRLKLLVVFDAILVEGSLARAGEKLGKTPPAMSRILKKLRDHFDDELFERTGKGLVPTRFAEDLRPRIRALVAEANSLLGPTQEDTPKSTPLLRRPPLALNQWKEPRTGPSAVDIAHRIAVLGSDSDPVRRLAAYIATIGNATGQTRPLDETEAEDAFRILLSKQVVDVQIGAFLIALQSRGMTDQELAGFTRAARSQSGLADPGAGQADLDWPAYLSPRAHGLPLFIHSARLVSQAGYRVVMHGYEDGVVRRAFEHAQLPVVRNCDSSLPTPRNAGLSFLPIEDFAPSLRQLLWLYPLFMMPNATHFIAPMLNPGGAAVTLTGMRAHGRPMLQRDAAVRLGWETYAVLSGHRDVAQVVPGKGQDLFLMRAGTLLKERVGSSAAQMVRRADKSADKRDDFNRLETWQAIWDGEVAPTAALETILETAALALTVLSKTTSIEQAREQAKDLWAARRGGGKTARSEPTSTVL
nr:LysR family transcriptional regulator [Amylibacter sp.]